MTADDLRFDHKLLLDYLWGDLPADKTLEVDRILQTDRDIEQRVDDFLFLALTYNMDKAALSQRILSLENNIKARIQHLPK